MTLPLPRTPPPTWNAEWMNPGTINQYIFWRSTNPLFASMHVSEHEDGNTHSSYGKKAISRYPHLEHTHHGFVNRIWREGDADLKAIYEAFRIAHPTRAFEKKKGRKTHLLELPAARHAAIEYDDFYDYDAVNSQASYTFGLDRSHNRYNGYNGYNGQQYLGNILYNNSIEYAMVIIPLIMLICVVFCLGCIISNICISVGCYMFGKTQKTKKDVIEYQVNFYTQYRMRTIASF
eukprot:495216_1